MDSPNHWMLWPDFKRDEMLEQIANRYELNLAMQWITEDTAKYNLELGG